MPPPAAVLAEIEIYHTRPAVPTRRVALGHLVLPVDPAPGFGGLLLGAVVAQHIRGLDREVLDAIGLLIRQVQRGDRIVQPRLRHRFQVDRHGLSTSRHQIFGSGDELSFRFDTHGHPLAQVLGAIYALERLDESARQQLGSVLAKALAWRGPVGPLLIAHLAGTSAAAITALADPYAWALDTLGFGPDSGPPSKRDITKRYRSQLRGVHPDHGGADADASRAISDLNEARRILIDDVRRDHRDDRHDSSSGDGAPWEQATQDDTQEDDGT